MNCIFFKDHKVNDPYCISNFGIRKHTAILQIFIHFYFFTQLAKANRFALENSECRLSNSAPSLLIGAVYQSSALSGVALEQTGVSILT